MLFGNLRILSLYWHPKYNNNYQNTTKSKLFGTLKARLLGLSNKDSNVSQYVK